MELDKNRLEEEDEEEETGASISQITHSSLLHAFGIYMFSEDVTNKSCSRVMEFILEANLNPNRMFDKIQLIINSRGGGLDAAFALCDVMQGSRVPIYTTGLGLIASAGLVIFMAGQKGHRTLTPNTMILSHQWSMGVHGKEHELIASIKAFDMLKDKIMDHYKTFTGLTEKKIKQYLLPPSDVWITPEEAIKLKIADEIVQPKQKINEVLP